MFKERGSWGQSVANLKDFNKTIFMNHFYREYIVWYSSCWLIRQIPFTDLIKNLSVQSKKKKTLWKCSFVLKKYFLRFAFPIFEIIIRSFSMFRWWFELIRPWSFAPGHFIPFNTSRAKILYQILDGLLWSCFY